MMDPITYNFQTSATDKGTRLDKFLSHQLPDMSRNRIQQLINEGVVHTSQGTLADCAYRVKSDESITVTVPPAIPSDIRATDIPITTIFEDEHLLVINKPAGLTVHPGAGNHQDTLVNGLLFHFKDKLSGIGGVQRPGIVHRLDKDTSGLMLIAKHDLAHTRLSEMIAQRLVKRHYMALCWGYLTPSHGTFDAPIGRHPVHRTRMTVTTKQGKHAVTHYQVKQIYHHNIASLVECQLETGRTHQIRVHLAHVDHPIIGDPVYGGRSHKKYLASLPEPLKTLCENFNRQALHAFHLAFEHPITKDNLEFSAPPPADFENLRQEFSKL